MPKRVDHNDIVQYIVTRAYWYGSISRKELIARFSVGSDLASRVIASLRDQGILHATGLKYVLNSECINHPLVAPLLGADKFLAEVGTSQSRAGGVSPVPFWSFSSLQPIVRHEVLRALFMAIRDKTTIEVIHVSMEPGAQATLSTVEPVEFVETAGRWYVRALSYETKEHIHIEMLQILRTGKVSKGKFGVAAQARKGVAEAFFVPHPLLGDAQKDVVRFQFRMQDGRLRLRESQDRLCHFKENFVSKSAAAIDAGKHLVQLASGSNFVEPV